MPKLQISLKSCDELQAALDTARSLLEPPVMDPITGLTPGELMPDPPRNPMDIMEEILQIEQAMREAGCPIA